MGSKSPHSRRRYVFWPGEWLLASPFLRIREMWELYAPSTRKGMGIPTCPIRIYWAFSSASGGVGWAMDISECREEAILANTPKQTIE